MELYKVYPAEEFRHTQDVMFNNILIVDGLTTITRVEHGSNAVSPGSIDECERPWYMHPHQIDNLIVFSGTRIVDLYTKEHGLAQFEITPDLIKKDGEVIQKGPAILMWPTNVFHRVRSGDSGSMAVNFAVRSKAFDIKTNFNIYDLNPETGEYKVVREGFKDQKEPDFAIE